MWATKINGYLLRAVHLIFSKGGMGPNGKIVYDCVKIVS